MLVPLLPEIDALRDMSMSGGCEVAPAVNVFAAWSHAYDGACSNPSLVAAAAAVVVVVVVAVTMMLKTLLMIEHQGMCASRRGTRGD